VVVARVRARVVGLTFFKCDERKAGREHSKSSVVAMMVMSDTSKGGVIVVNVCADSSLSPSHHRPLLSS